MKHTLPLIAAAACMMYSGAIPSLAMDIYPPALRASLHQEAKKTLSRNEGTDQSPYLPILLQVESYDIEGTLSSMGVITYGQREHILLTSIPRDSVDEVLNLPQIINAEMSSDTRVQLDVARPMCHVDALQSGLAPLPQSYDGTGVVVGFSDIGFDARHIAFKDRISAIYTYNARQGIRQEMLTAQEINAWTTDNADEYHATHVANILGGNYRGAPYWGVATGAEMVATTSTLTDVGILAGVEDIISYAKAQGKRAVINLSLASFIGPHDGTSLFCRYLSSCADEAVICLSAGNKGDTQCYATATLADAATIKRVAVNDIHTWTGKTVEGVTEIWSADSGAFSMRIEIFDKDTKDIVYASAWTDPALEYNEIYMTSDEDEEFAKYMEGQIFASAALSTLNNRYYASTSYDMSTTATQAISDGRWARYAICIAVKQAHDSQSPVNLEFFADATTSFIGTVPGNDSPRFSNDGSISDMCTAKGVISVGNCNSRNTSPSVYGADGVVKWDFEVGNVASSSSYSTSPYIGKYPHFSAPGNRVVSALSGEYEREHPSKSPNITAISDVDDRKYYWIAESGTSMASPMAAGIIALWLQANPNLTTSEIIEIAQSTAITDYSDFSNPRWGAGCIDALAGTRKALALNGILDTTIDDASVFNPDGSISVPDGAMIYSIQGYKAEKITDDSKGIFVIRCADGRTFKWAK